MTILWLDTETFSATPIKHGTYKYAENAEVMLVTYAFDAYPVQAWDRTEGAPMPPHLRVAFDNPEVVLHIHNVPFDRAVMYHSMGLDLPIERFYDTSIQARAHALPGKLGEWCGVMGIAEDKAKHKEGRALINLFCKPMAFKYGLKRKDFPSAVAYKAARAAALAAWPGRATKRTHPVEWDAFVRYAVNDVVAMRECSNKTPTWNYQGAELALWYLDQKINDRGIYVDLALAHAGIAAVEKEKERLRVEVQALTEFDGEGQGLRSSTERAKFLSYVLETYGIVLPNMKKATLELALTDPDIPLPVKELINNRLEASGTAATKYKRVIEAANTDGRVRGTLQFDGAGRTRRWAGRVIQPQNMFKSKLKPKDVALGIELLKLGGAELVFDNVMLLCASVVRGVIVSPPGSKLVVSDLANIEGRVQAWSADEAWKLQAFRDFDVVLGTDASGKDITQGPDLYKLAYARSFAVPISAVGDRERQIGKIMELALAYAGGVGAFVVFALSMRIDLEALADKVFDTLPEDVRAQAKSFYEWMTKQGNNTYKLAPRTYIMCETFKRLWRAAHPGISSLWKELETAVKTAIAHPGVAWPCRSFVVRRDKNWLRIGLPSGRWLCYPAPQVSDKGQISYMGQNQYTRKWSRIPSHGGKFFENICQSLARDVMADNMPQIEAAGYGIVLTAHDEVVAEVPNSPTHNHEDLSRLLSATHAWCPDIPLAAKGFEDFRYRKD